MRPERRERREWVVGILAPSFLIISPVRAGNVRNRRRHGGRRRAVVSSGSRRAESPGRPRRAPSAHACRNVPGKPCRKYITNATGKEKIVSRREVGFGLFASSNTGNRLLRINPRDARLLALLSARRRSPIIDKNRPPERPTAFFRRRTKVSLTGRASARSFRHGILRSIRAGPILGHDAAR